MYKVTIVIPAYKAQNTIEECLSSINFQSMRDDIEVIISNDNPGDDYGYLKKMFPKLHLSFIDTAENGGPGKARSRGIEKANGEWVAFIDADDVYYTPYAIDTMYQTAISNQGCIQVQSVFVQPVMVDGIRRLLPRTDLTHPWSFARLTNVKFLRDNGIDFGSLRAMEDGEFEWKIRMLIDGTQLKIMQTNDIAYVWKEGSEHSITRTGTELNGGIPLYNFGLCQLGASLAAKHAIDFVVSKNPFNVNPVKFATEQMVGHYFTYYECLQNCEKYAKQNWWLSKWFYHQVFGKYCNNVSIDILNNMYFQMFAAKAGSFKKMPDLTFEQWFEKIKTENFEMNELVEIRKELSDEIIKAEISTGVVTENILEMFEG